ncbi:MAG: VWA domain-containing protein [Candidatus Hydrogenedentes bacterium]|nr:VWA domain-containing protein [Candidatus Hydrogenedentota bacterium]
MVTESYRRSRKSLWIVNITTAITLSIASTANSAGLLVADGGLGGVLAITEHTVRVTVNNGIAVTEVYQVFQNTENREVEALYTFPVPRAASVSNFSMWIHDTEMIGEVVEKQRAREIYETYKNKRRDPGLLEQVDYRSFEMRIFPIAPGAAQRVQITYYQELDFDHDWATFVYPLATATRPQVDSRVSGRFGLTLEVRSEIPITAMESPSHADDFVIVSHNDSFYEASLEAAEGSLARDLVIAYQISRPQTGVDIITSRASGEDGYFCMMITAGEELEGNPSGMDYVFVIDASGSMASERKFETSSNAVQAFVEALGDEDRFDALAFNVQPVTLYGSLQSANNEAKAAVAKFLDSQTTRGGTNLRLAVTKAYEYADPATDRQLNVVVLSDGLATQDDPASLIALIRNRPANARVFCVGVGNDVNQRLLVQMAEEAGGLAAMISRGDDFARQAHAFRRKLTRPAATNLRVDFQGGEIYDVVPEQLPNLYHGTPVRLYGRYKAQGEVPVAVHAEVQGQALDNALTVSLPAEDAANPEIERMWAWHRVQRLLKQADDAGDRSGVTAEIVRLGEAYSIATEYTSFLVLENNKEYQRWQIERRNALRIERDRRAQKRLREELEAMRASGVEVNPAQPAPPPEQRADSRNTNRADTPGQNFDIPTPGGAAIDPVTGVLAIGFAVVAWCTARRKK